MRKAEEGRNVASRYIYPLKYVQEVLLDKVNAARVRRERGHEEQFLTG